jgi:probable F420-dependent oxidoreductase
MKLNVALPGTHHIPGTPEWTWRLTPAELRRAAAAADANGYDALTAPEHFAMPYFEVPRLGPYWMHALSVMSFMAASTDRIRIDASVLVLPYHHPLDLAKALSTIDVLSAGRLNVSVGVGHAVAEFESLGVPFTERGARSDEILAAMEELWSAEEPVFHGRYYTIEGLAFEPKPVQDPRPPIYVGGNSPAAIRRATRYDGWMCNPSHCTLDDLPGLLDQVRAQPDFAGKEATFDLHWMGAPPLWGEGAFGQASPAALSSFKERLLEWFAQLAGLGINRNSLPLAHTDSLGEYVDYLAWFAAEVRPEIGR